MTEPRQLDQLLCPECHGLGWKKYSRSDPVERCHSCGGSGWRDLDDAIEWLRAKLQEVRDEHQRAPDSTERTADL